MSFVSTSVRISAIAVLVIFITSGIYNIKMALITQNDDTNHKRIHNYDPVTHNCTANKSVASHVHDPNTKSHNKPLTKCICDTNQTRKIFVLGFPKAGTKSLHYLFRAIGCESIHWNCNNNEHINKACANFEILRQENVVYDKDKTRFLGYLMDLAHRNNKSLLHFVQTKYRAFAQMDVCWQDINVWPQLIWYKLLYHQYPDSLFILNHRNMDHHIQSISYWTDLRKRIYKHDVPGLPKGIGMKDAEIKEWMLRHYCNVETFFSQYAPDSFLKFDIEKDNVTKLEKFLHCGNLTIPHAHAREHKRRRT